MTASEPVSATMKFTPETPTVASRNSLRSTRRPILASPLGTAHRQEE